eukprot:scaffold23_cov268-Pinguiococcus_pyrenoidosus.AAC.13
MRQNSTQTNRPTYPQTGHTVTHHNVLICAACYRNQRLVHMIVDLSLTAYSGDTRARATLPSEKLSLRVRRLPEDSSNASDAGVSCESVLGVSSWTVVAGLRPLTKPSSVEGAIGAPARPPTNAPTHAPKFVRSSSPMAGPGAFHSALDCCSLAAAPRFCFPAGCGRAP